MANDDSINEFADKSAELRKNMQESAEQATAFQKIFRDTSQIFGDINDFQKEILATLEDENSNLSDKEKILKSVEKLYENEDKFSKTQMKFIEKRLEKAYKYSNIIEKHKKNQEEQTKLADILSDKASDYVDNIQSSIKSIPIVGDLLANRLNFDKIKEDFKENVSKDIANGMSGLGASAKSFGKTFIKSLLPILPIVAAISALKTAFTLDKQVTELSRNMGISRDAALDMQLSFKSISDSAGNLTTGEIASAQQQLAEATGMTAKFSDDMLKTQAELTKFYGLSGEEAANLSTYMTSIGSDAETLKGEVIGVVDQFNQGTGASVNMNDVLKDIAGLSATMKANFKGNNTEMVKAVTLARAMGTSLEKSAQAAEKTLDIESSLKAELTAQMAAGVKIDNSAIRRAQIMGDQEEVLRLQKEQMEEIGDISGMIPKQREAIAKAMGMELSELDEMNERMEVQRQLGVDLSEATLDQIDSMAGMSPAQKEALKAQKEQLSLQENMAMVTEKVQEVFVEIAPHLMVIVDFIGQAVSAVSTLITGLGGLKNILRMVAGYYVIKAAYAAYASLAAIPIIGQGAGLLAAGATLAAGTAAIAAVGDVMSPADGKTRVSTKEGGLFELSPNDDLVAAPGLLKGGGSSIDLSPLINAINGLRSDIQSQPIQMVVDGKVVSSISKVQARQQSVNTVGYGK